MKLALLAALAATASAQNTQCNLTFKSSSGTACAAAGTCNYQCALAYTMAVSGTTGTLTPTTTNLPSGCKCDQGTVTINGNNFSGTFPGVSISGSNSGGTVSLAGSVSGTSTVLCTGVFSISSGTCLGTTVTTSDATTVAVGAGAAIAAGAAVAMAM